MFVNIPQESYTNTLVEDQDKIVAARLAKALLEGSNVGSEGGSAVAKEEAAASAVIADLTMEVAGIQVAWMNVVRHPLHQQIVNMYHPKGMSQDLPTVSYVDLKLGEFFVYGSLGKRVS